jgi:hypothetical protein
MVRLYHTTTAEKADSIMAHGFRDHATTNKRLTATYRYEPGVWFGDVAAIDDELFDGIGMFDFDAEMQAFIAVTPGGLSLAVRRRSIIRRRFDVARNAILGKG